GPQATGPIARRRGSFRSGDKPPDRGKSPTIPMRERPTCPECGLHYVVGLPEDEEFHAKFHAEYQHGRVLAEIAQIPSIETLNGLTIHLVDEKIPFEIRKQFYWLALVAQREIGGPAGFDGTINEEDQRLFFAANGQHAIA